MKCTGHTKAGAPCRGAAMAGKSVCRMHGGLTPAGAASPHFKHGRYSKYLPAEILARYQEGARDPDLLSMRGEILLTDARLSQIAERLGTGESTELWLALLRVVKALRAAEKAANSPAAEASEALRGGYLRDREQAIDSIEWLVGEAVLSEKAWAEFDAQKLMRAKLVETESRRLVQMGQMITAAECLTMLGAITGIITRYVSDTQALRAIERDIAGLAVLESRRQSLAGPPA